MLNVVSEEPPHELLSILSELHQVYQEALREGRLKVFQFFLSCIGEEPFQVADALHLHFQFFLSCIM